MLRTQSFGSRIDNSWPGRSTERLIGVAAILGVWLLFLLYVTLFPFDFYAGADASIRDFIEQGKWSLFAPDLRDDIPRNIVLFIPFGFAFAELISPGLSTIMRTVLVCCAGIVLSSCVEVAQYFLLVRYTVLTDLVANTAGTLVGALLAAWLARSVLGLLAAIGRRAARSMLAAPAALLVAIWAIWLGGVGLLAITAQQRIWLRNWEPAYPLLVGNEATGDRQWDGAVEAIYFGSLALSPTAVARAFAGDDPAALLGDDALAHYRRGPDDTYVDVDGHQPALLAQTGEGGIWWSSASPPEALSRAIAASSQFTLVADLVAARRNQEGPARIISLSATPYARNLTIGQEGDDLVVRLRTPFTGDNGRAPELHIAEVFSDLRPIRLVVTYGTATLQIYLDGPDTSYSLVLRPETIAILGWPPVEAWGLRLNAVPVRVYQICSAVMMFGPATTLLTLATRRLSPPFRRAILAAGVVLPPLLLEAAIVIFGQFPPIAGAAIAGVAVGTVVVPILLKLVGPPSGATV